MAELNMVRILQNVSEATSPSVEITHDSARNIWFSFNDAPLQESILEGNVTNKGVITVAGRAFIPEHKRREIMQRATRGLLLQNLRELGSGAEGRVKVVTDAPNRLASLMRIHNYAAAVKTLISPLDNPLLPWETIQVFDAIRPAFDEHQLKLITPYGAVNNDIYLPFIDGKNVEGYLKKIGNPELAGALRKSLEERTLPLHHAVHDKLHGFLGRHGLERNHEGDQLNDNDADLYPDPRHPGNDIRALVDLHPGKSAHTYDLTRRYRNWMISGADIKILETAGSLSDAKDFFVRSVVAVDPFLVFSRNKNALPLGI